MLIKIQAHTGVEFVNPDQISHVSMMRGYALIHLSNQAMLPIDLTEWERVEKLIAMPCDVLQVRYNDALQAIFRQSSRIQELEVLLAETQSGQPGPADDLKPSAMPDVDELPF
jgi:hypothetical protein